MASLIRKKNPKSLNFFHQKKKKIPSASNSSHIQYQP